MSVRIIATVIAATMLGFFTGLSVADARWEALWQAQVKTTSDRPEDRGWPTTVRAQIAPMNTAMNTPQIGLLAAGRSDDGWNFIIAVDHAGRVICAPSP